MSAHNDADRLRERLDNLECEICVCGAETKHRNWKTWEYCRAHELIDEIRVLATPRSPDAPAIPHRTPEQDVIYHTGRLHGLTEGMQKCNELMAAGAPTEPLLTKKQQKYNSICDHCGGINEECTCGQPRPLALGAPTELIVEWRTPLPVYKGEGESPEWRDGNNVGRENCADELEAWWAERQGSPRRTRF